MLILKHEMKRNTFNQELVISSPNKMFANYRIKITTHSN